jgi:hypothetical protein
MAVCFGVKRLPVSITAKVCSVIGTTLKGSGIAKKLIIDVNAAKKAA